MTATYVDESTVVDLPDDLLERPGTLVRPLVPVKGATPRAALRNGFTYRHAWSNKTRGGVFTLNNFFGIKPDWNVFISAGEAIVLGDATAGSFVGNARFTVTNVSPADNKMIFRVAIENFDGAYPWPGGPLAIITDFLVVPFS